MTEREMTRKKAAARKARKERERKARNRRVVMTVALMLVVCVASIGGTIAWLTSESDVVENTFTTSDITVTLTEEGTTEDDEGNLAQSFKMIPGHVIDKKPIVTVAEGSEDCWVFLKVKAQNTEDYLDWAINPINWTKLNTDVGIDAEKGESVYYCKVPAVGAGSPISVLGYGTAENFVKDQVRVKDTVTKELMNATSDKPVMLTFEASAVQLYKTNGVEFKPEEAWGILNSSGGDNGDDSAVVPVPGGNSGSGT